MKKSALLLLSGLIALPLAPRANAQVASRVVYSCDYCISNGAARDVDLNGALAMKQVDVGTYFLVLDGPQNTSVAYAATTVDSLGDPSQPHRTLANGQHLIMKPVANPFADLVSMMLSFHKAYPAGWKKEFPAPGSQLTFPDPSITIWGAAPEGESRRAMLMWADTQLTGQIATVRGYMYEMARAMNATVQVGARPAIIILLGFQDGSRATLVADTKVANGRFQWLPDQTRDKSGNWVPGDASQIGGPNVGEIAMYDFRSAPDDQARFLARARHWGVPFTGTPGPKFTCTAVVVGVSELRPHCSYD